MSVLISTLKLIPGRDFSVRRGHPWIFSGALEKGFQKPGEGALVRVLASNDECLGVGFYSGQGSIAVKMLTREDREIEFTFWEERIAAAIDRRSVLGLIDNEATTAFRLFNAEGDSVPGLIIDLYGETAVVQCQSAALRSYLGDIAEIVRKLVPRLKGIYLKTHEDTEEFSSRYLWGGGGEQIIKEHGLKFRIDWETGQKTGFFLDQRENRKLISGLSRNKRVLNAFCYTGGFTIAALAGGAQSVVSIDSSKPALELLEKNVALNFESARHEAKAEDFFRSMQNLPRTFDLIVLDPPAFAKDRRAVKSGLKGYRSINEAAFRALPSGGILATFSCSQLVSTADFRAAVTEAAHTARRSARIVAQLHQAPCHPVHINHPEGEYLKGLVLVVD